MIRNIFIEKRKEISRQRKKEIEKLSWDTKYSILLSYHEIYPLLAHTHTQRERAGNRRQKEREKERKREREIRERREKERDRVRKFEKERQKDIKREIRKK